MSLRPTLLDCGRWINEVFTMANVHPIHEHTAMPTAYGIRALSDFLRCAGFQIIFKTEGGATFIEHTLAGRFEIVSSDVPKHEGFLVDDTGKFSSLASAFGQHRRFRPLPDYEIREANIWASMYRCRTGDVESPNDPVIQIVWRRTPIFTDGQAA